MLLQVTLELIRKSGVREWDSELVRIDLGLAAVEIVEILLGEFNAMALPDTFKVSAGTALTIRNTGGSAALSFASLANGNGTSAGGRQSATLDLGVLWARLWRINTDFELAATPTAGNAINLLASYHSATGAGQGNTSGSDAAYTGYSNNIDAATRQLELIGAHNCTSQATATVQRAFAGIFMPKGRYMNVVVDNRSGAAFHSTETNQVITLTPLEETVED